MKKFNFTKRFLLTIFTLISLMTSLISCNKKYEVGYDKDLNKSAEQFEKDLNRQENRKNKYNPYIPKNKDVVINRDYERKLSKILVSVNASTKVAVQSILMDISSKTGIDMQIDPSIEDKISMNVHDKPMIDVINNIVEVSNIRYKFTGKDDDMMIVFEVDEPHSEVYSVNFLNSIRSSNGSTNIRTSVMNNGGGGEGGASGTMSSGSNVSLSTSRVDTFWQDMISSVTQIVVEENKISKKREEKNKDKEKKEKKKKKKSRFAKDDEEDDEEDHKNRMSTAMMMNSGQQIGADGNPIPQNGMNGMGQNGMQNGMMNQQQASGNQYVMVNKQSGLITVTANSKAHKQIAKYLKELKKKTLAQVMITMKVLEVTLNKEFYAGIDLSSLSTTSGYSLISSTPTLPSVSTPFTLGTLRKNSMGETTMSTIVNAIEKFGTVRTLISPKLTVAHNQQAVMTIADNEVYFKVSYDIIQPIIGTGGQTIGTEKYAVNSDVRTVPVGIIMGMQPSIDLDKREVVMNIIPMITKIKEWKTDPASQYLAGMAKTTVISQIPVVVMRELNTIVRMIDGDVMVMGGFNEQVNTITERFVPILGKIPVVGWLFRSRLEQKTINETLIVLQANIIDGESLTSDDRKFYKDFTGDKL